MSSAPSPDGERRCPACGSTELAPVASVADVPVHVGVLWRTEEEARRCATGRLELVACSSCGLLTNTAFDESLLDYSLDYDNSLHASSVFRDFESGLVSDLVERHDLHGKQLVEIGGGDGRFVGLLCDAGSNRGVCFDPSAPAVSDRPDVRIVAEYFGSDTSLERFDLMVCRQVLEHVPDLHGFLAPIRGALERYDATAYFDVPDSTMLLRDLSIWDLVYEHCHYFVEESLVSLLRGAGLTVTRTWGGFGDQFLSAEVTTATVDGTGPASSHGASSDGPSGELQEMVSRFSTQMERRRTEWGSRLDRMRSSGKRVAVWGAGARAVTFCAMLDGAAAVDYFVDANPAKQGTFLAGSGHAIHEPARLGADTVDLVVLLNGIYEEEIRGELAILNPDAELVVA